MNNVDHSIAADARPASEPSLRPAYYALFLLTVSQFLASIDQYSFTLLLEPIKADLGASDTQMSLLTGFAFVLFYTLFGIPIARLIDRHNRRNILGFCLAAWSIMTALCGAASTFALMALARAGMGIGQAGSAPASLSLIADLFPKNRRAQAIGWFQSAPALTAIVGIPIVALVTEAYGWRTALFVMAVPGILLAVVLMLTMREPRRGATDAVAETADVGSIWDAVRIMIRSRAFVLTFLSQAICASGYGVIAVWAFAFLIRVYDVNVGELGAIVGPIYAPFMIVGSVGGGVLASWLIRRTGNERWIVLVPAISALLAVPATIGFLLIPSMPVLLGCGAVMNMFLLARNAPVLTLAIDLVPSSARAVTGAVMLLASDVIGLGVGPLLTGLVSDTLEPSMGSAEGLRWAILLTGPTLMLVGGAVGFLALRDVSAGRRAEEENVTG